jgi:hypothetical protein
VAGESGMNRWRGVVIILLLGSGAAMAGEAVSGVNGKLGYLGGSMDGDFGNNVFGSFSVPVAQNLGFQGDGLYTHVSDVDFTGAGGHLFWRDWDKGLFGVTGGFVHGDLVDSAAGGLEGEYYLGRWTFLAGFGVAGIDYDNPVPFIDTSVTDFYGSAGLRYYPLDDLMFGATYLHVLDNELAFGQLEYQTPIHGLSLFAEVARGENDYEHALFGAQFYFGKSKSLIRRHREDDPPSIVRQILDGIGVYGAEYNKTGQEYVESHPSEYPGGSYGYIYTYNYGLSATLLSPETIGPLLP